MGWRMAWRWGTWPGGRSNDIDFTEAAAVGGSLAGSLKFTQQSLKMPKCQMAKTVPKMVAGLGGGCFAWTGFSLPLLKRRDYSVYSGEVRTG
jgi:hypothetical protein